MLIHIFGFRWKETASVKDRNKALSEISAFRGKIDGLTELHVGDNVSSRSLGYETVGVMKFADLDAFEAYTTHPLHMGLLSWLLPLTEPVEFDLVIGGNLARPA